MERKTVTSSALSSVGYDPETKVLEVGFPSKAVWRYADVPQEVFDRFMRAESLGRFFASDIRANYKAERVHLKPDCGAGVEPCLNEPCPCWCHNVTKGSSHAESTAQTESKPVQKRKAAQKKQTT
jgi:KTSC domain